MNQQFNAAFYIIIGDIALWLPSSRGIWLNSLTIYDYKTNTGKSCHLNVSKASI